ncbi:hypothetical protein [Rhizobium hidalgonense]|uniref:hypothetical protein n=1 Tax=Rhizobium hidalgonense TaxID=1538159 RepID=UPI001FDF069B|nr:hypothetical protein [Rhizobium hidalgonense]
MPRNPSTGVYSKPAGTTPSVGQIIDPAPWNQLTTDLGNEITNSLPRDGSAPMVAPLKLAAGTVSVPGLGFSSVPQTGLYLKGTSLGFTQNGVDIAFGRASVYAAKSGAYTALAVDDNAVLRFTATATLSLTAAATLAANWRITIIADGGDVTIDPDASETIDGAATLLVPNGGWVNVFCSGSAFFTNKTAAQGAAIANMKWRSRFIGEVVYANTAITGAETPPTSVTDTVWIELTSGLTGVGQFNNAKLTSESISGSAPLVLATAAISYAGSAMNGQTIRLINTESRILRPSISPGTIQDDAFQGHRHPTGTTVFTGGAGGIGTGSGNINPLTIGDPTTDGTNGTPRTASETRMKNIGVKAYMRIA